jgi:hypothetical protein
VRRLEFEHQDRDEHGEYTVREKAHPVFVGLSCGHGPLPLELASPRTTVDQLAVEFTDDSTLDGGPSTLGQDDQPVEFLRGESVGPFALLRGRTSIHRHP